MFILCVCMLDELLMILSAFAEGKPQGSFAKNYLVVDWENGQEFNAVFLILDLVITDEDMDRMDWNDADNLIN